uniref:cell adhesion molecule CEACAM21-like isoform X2 n=1 Tax=Pristiophorus japonicus TaxID=55135 RepID=UPI00398EEA94
MARVRAAAALWLLLSASLCSSAAVKTIHGFLQHNVSLPVTRPSRTTEIVCKFNGNKVFEWESDMATYFAPFSGRTELKEKSVLIEKLQKADAGFYLLQFTLNDGKIEEASFSLKVLVPLSMPTIICTLNASIVYLDCYLNDQDPNVTTEWKHRNITLIPNDNFHLSNANKYLTILNPEKFPGEYTCIVEQPENSSQSNPFQLSNCFEKEGNYRTHIIIPVVLLLAVLIIIAVIINLRQKRTKCDHMTGEGTQEPLNAEASPENPGESEIQNSPASNESEKIREDSADIGNPKDME